MNNDICISRAQKEANCRSTRIQCDVYAAQNPEVLIVSEGKTLLAGYPPLSPPIEFAPSSSPLPYTVFAPTLFEFDPIKSSSPLD